MKTIKKKGIIKKSTDEDKNIKQRLNSILMEEMTPHVQTMWRRHEIIRSYGVIDFNKDLEIIEVIYDGRKGIIVRISFDTGFVVKERKGMKGVEKTIATGFAEGFFQSRVYRSMPKNPEKVALMLQDDRGNDLKQGIINYEFFILDWKKNNND